ncbi:hypothetical protein SteCoe_1666 [Stentor coeruleus]|uniref:Inosine/uridine-preferring nucleoside hydrolase domain-containing protein n=1 Tax=Stentor coeruleus TaxID=5963 RepID=A0A1R2D153_9CILI|nr:hypothetical protein SteCoe_1666 [Stentor coeruleus]
MQKWIIDTDPGIDDVMALLVALASNIEIIAITTVAGNTTERNVYRNVIEVLRIAGKEVPIYRGSKRPLLNQLNTCHEFHGEDGINDYWKTHSDNFQDIQTEHAASAISRLSKSGDVNIICLGPLTNLAIAYLQDDTLEFASIHLMGGTINAAGNTTALSEFNIYQDPEAAYIVFDRAPHLSMIPWECTFNDDVKLKQNFLEAAKNAGPRGRFMVEICQKVNYACDAIAMMTALYPETIEESEDRHVKIELAGNYSRGHTIVHRDPRSILNPTLKKFTIVKKIHHDFFFNRFLQLLVDS